MINLDSQGNPLAVGQRVAYNLSGLVVPGVIIELTATHIKIRSGHRYSVAGHVSKVRYGDSILVLDHEYTLIPKHLREGIAVVTVDA